MTDVDLWFNFALNAVLGRLADADAILSISRPSIRRVAGWLNTRAPIVAKPIYRGMLLDPSKPARIDPAYKFISWSEDRDVACWFAHPRATISQPLVESKPNLRGFVFTLEAPTRVLFHHTWANHLGADLFAKLARMHPFIGAEGARQIAWALRTQQEVITEPLDAMPDGQALDTIEHPPLATLERLLTPAWVAATEGYAS